MADPSTHINYSFEDIQRYLQGKMTAAEMHAVEKAALQDPFLADAIEGYNEVDLNTAKQHLNDINAGLFTEKQKPKVIAFNKKTQWFSIAAMIIVIAGIALFSVYSLNNSNKKQEIAQVKEEPVNNRPALTDSSAISPTSAEIKQEPVVAQDLHKAKSNYTKQKEPPQIAATTKEEATTEEAGTPGLVASAAPVRQDETALKSFALADTAGDHAGRVQKSLQGKSGGPDMLPANFSGKVVDENNKPIAGVIIESSDKKAAVITDVNGNFSLQKNDTLLNVTAGTIGYASRSAFLKNGMNDPIVLKETTSGLNEMAVVGNAKERKKNAYADPAMPVQRKAVSDAATPVGGWKNFNNYVLSELNKDTTAAGVTLSGDLIEMEFSIDNTGNPYNIKITRPLDEERNTKAIEILRSGPKWTNTSKNKKARVTIAF